MRLVGTAEVESRTGGCFEFTQIILYSLPLSLGLRAMLGMWARDTAQRVLQLDPGQRVLERCLM